MKASELRKMPKDELIKKEKELREELGNLAFKNQIRPLENPARLRQLRKDIARIKTLYNEESSN